MVVFKEYSIIILFPRAEACVKLQQIRLCTRLWTRLWTRLCSNCVLIVVYMAARWGRGCQRASNRPRQCRWGEVCLQFGLAAPSVGVDHIRLRRTVNWMNANRRVEGRKSSKSCSKTKQIQAWHCKIIKIMLKNGKFKLDIAKSSKSCRKTKRIQAWHCKIIKIM